MAIRTSAVLRVGLVLVWLAAVLSGCAGTDEQPALDGTTWTLTGWSEPGPLPVSVTITAEFADGRVAGWSGVNRYHAPVDSGSDGSFAIGPPATTLMAGPEEAMAAETAYLRRLEAATSYRVNGDTLMLTDADGQPSLTFARS